MFLPLLGAYTTFSWAAIHDQIRTIQVIDSIINKKIMNTKCYDGLVTERRFLPCLALSLMRAQGDLDKGISSFELPEIGKANKKLHYSPIKIPMKSRLKMIKSHPVLSFHEHQIFSTLHGVHPSSNT